jgi:hypothetical protein
MLLRVLPERLAICKLPAAAPVPEWAAGGFTSVTRTRAELSIVCPQEAVPPAVSSVGGWRAFEVEGPLDFGLTGILSSIARPLADAQISIFAISTFDTDYVLVREGSLEHAERVLRAAGHSVTAA